jgi:hypothetical protein
MAHDDDEGPGNGVVAGSPAPLFEKFEEQLLADAGPFRNRPQPIGGSRKGIPNKRANQMRELYLKSGLPHPLLWQGQLLRNGIDGLAQALDCKPIEAAELLRKVAADALPYIEGKMPNKVIVEGGAGLPVLIFGDRQAALDDMRQAQGDGSMSIDDGIVLSVQNQPLGRGDAVRPESASSHDEAKPLSDSEKEPSGS